MAAGQFHSGIRKGRARNSLGGDGGGSCSTGGPPSPPPGRAWWLHHPPPPASQVHRSVTEKGQASGSPQDEGPCFPRGERGENGKRGPKATLWEFRWTRASHSLYSWGPGRGTKAAGDSSPTTTRSHKEERSEMRGNCYCTVPHMMHLHCMLYKKLHPTRRTSHRARTYLGSQSLFWRDRHVCLACWGT